MQDIITEIELHSVEGIRNCFKNGDNPNQNFKRKPLIYELISEYTRTSRFKDCVRVFVEYGLVFEDQPLLTVLMDDSEELEVVIRQSPEIIRNTYTLKSAYTPLEQVTLLHICAEFNHVSCAEVLINYGADINATAGIDEHGFGGQTPVFHTVNSNRNHSKPMLDFLLSQKADLSITVPGIIWGKGYEWETLIPAVNPLSYAMMGLLPQMHRDEREISEIVSLLLNANYGIDYQMNNIPNAYLKS
jgi:ankyrin repeat protein